MAALKEEKEDAVERAEEAEKEKKEVEGRLDEVSKYCFCSTTCVE